MRACVILLSLTLIAAFECHQPAFYDPFAGACKCPQGFRLRSDRISCDDIDECTRPLRVCPNTMCMNLPGSYRCIPVARTESYCFNRELLVDSQIEWLGTWFANITQSAWRVQWLHELHELMFTCPSTLKEWLTSCATHNQTERIFWEIYHNSSCWASMTRETSPAANYTYGFTTDPHQHLRHGCDLFTDMFWTQFPSHAQHHIPLMAEYSAIIPLAFANGWFYDTVMQHSGMGVGSYKTAKFAKPCDGLREFHWEELPSRYMLQWNAWLTNDLKKQANEAHTGTPGMYTIIETFFSDTFMMELPKIIGPNSCCSHFYADSETWYRLGKLQVLGMMYFDVKYHDMQNGGYCPYVTYPIGQDHRCWAFAMERITDIYAFLSGTRRVVNTVTCRPEAPNLPLESLFYDVLIDSVWDALMCYVRGTAGVTALETVRFLN